MLRKRIVEFLGLESAIHWLGARINRDNVNATATVVLAVATIALCITFAFTLPVIVERQLEPA